MSAFLKQLSLVACLLLAAYTNANAQVEINRPIEEYSFNKNTVVTNAQGKPYTYANWSKLLATGKYKLKPLHEESDSTAFVLALRDAGTEHRDYASTAPKPTPFFKKGDNFLLVPMEDVNGKTITAKELKGKIIVVNFWFIACPPCRYEMPELNRIADTYKADTNVVFLAITFDKKADVQRFLKVSPFKYKVIPESMPLLSYYGINECPVSIVVDKKGIIAFDSLGYNNGSVPFWVEKTIEKLKAEK